jgi:hypothetical protein
VDKKQRILKMMELETMPSAERATLYGIEVSEFQTDEELRILAYWALTRWRTEMEAYG